MAVTSIWPIKGRVDGVINYAMNPEKTTELVPAKQLELHAIDGVIQYAENDLKTEKRSYVSTIGCIKGAEAEDFMRTMDRYPSRFQDRVSKGRRVCYHGYQSFAPGEVTAEVAHEIGVNQSVIASARRPSGLPSRIPSAMLRSVHLMV